MELADFGVDIPKEVIAKTVEEAAAFAESADCPLAMKVESADILHKSDVGGVKLNIRGKEAAVKAYEEIMNNVTGARPDAKINGILMVPMLKPGVEMIIGVNNDPQFGPMIMVGMGGVFVEVFKDVALYPAPLCEEEALDMLKSTEILQTPQRLQRKQQNAIFRHCAKPSRESADTPTQIKIL